ncbi:unnamed protein product [Lymnaea stagnalis]|uniref:Uncharacterized protein n=1 Tax=Lymnaea stagnalis TaxID=6523 RepID=A0AAV2HRE8_LYMST
MATGAFLGLLLLVCGATSENPGYFWHVTDFHYDHTYSTSKLSCNDDVPNLLKFGDYWCDSTWELVVDSIQAMASIKSDVDFLIWTGDTVAHISDANLTVDLNLEIVRNITEFINTTFQAAKVYASLGNHDFYPSGQARDKDDDHFYTRVGALWEEWIINQTGAKEDIRKGGYYAVKVQPKIRLLALNTNLYYTSDKLTPNLTDPTGQFEWMERQLNSSRANKEKVIITGHVPPGLFIPEYSDWFWPQFKKTFMKIMFDYSDVIVVTHFGHDHADSFKLLQNDDGSKMIPQFNAPSVTPWRYKIPAKTGDAHNPGIRLIKYDRDTGKPLDYTQYYINITQANAAQKSNWQPLYNFTAAYGVADMTPDSLKMFFQKLKDEPDSKLYQKFCNHWVVSDTDKRCTEAMKADIVCGGQIYDLTKAQQCSADRLKKANGAPTHSSFHYAMLILVAMATKCWGS